MRKQPLHFRKEEVQYIMRRWQAAESCALVGVGSVGKSNLLQHLSDSDVQAHYMEDGAQQFVAVMVDPHLLVPIATTDTEEFRCWAGYELMLHRLYLALYPFDALEEDAEHFFEAYETLQDGTNPLYAYMGLRYFELGLELILRRGIQIVFMFDEFEELLRKLPVKFFQTLRGLRDNHKNQLSYLTFSREPLSILTEKFNLPEAEFEPFSELFTDNVYYVGPYNSVDAHAMVERLIQRNPNLSHSQDAINFLLYATGRYAGIIRAGFRALEWLGAITAKDTTSQALVERLASRKPVQAECETIWNSLTELEQQVLIAIVRNTIENLGKDMEVGVPLLVQKRLLSVDKQRQVLEIHPPVLHAYINNVILRQ